MSFQKEETSEKIFDIISEKLKIPKSNINAQATFKDLGIDSLDSVELTMAFEDAFGIEISDEKASQISTIQDAINIVNDVRQK